MSTTERPVLYGAAYSVYVRAARLVLAEKAVAYDLVEVDIFAPKGPPDWYRHHHPFGRIPAFEHGDVRLYESSAIQRYVDELFPGPPLQPSHPRARARMNQVISIVDSYVYQTLVRSIFAERVRAPARGRPADEGKIADAIPKAETCLKVLNDIAAGDAWLAGEALSLADLQAAPMFAYFRMAPEGAAMLGRYPAIASWWDRLAMRPSMKATRSPWEADIE